MKILLLSRAGLAVVLLLSGSPLHAAARLIILQYHHVDHGTPASTSITPELFDRHIEYLRDNQYAILPLEDAVNAIRKNQPLPDKAVAITIDDAYRSVYTQVYPRLKALRWPFTVFVNPAAHDSGKGHYLSWDQMREMSRDGVTFANHTHTHLHMLRMKPGETEISWLHRVRQEIETAQQRLREELGHAPALFVYPYGEHNPALRKLVTELGYVGFGQQSGPAGPDSDFAALPRFPMAAGFASMARFPEKLNTWPLPVISVAPENAVLEGDSDFPELRLTLADADYRRDAVTCYISGQGRGMQMWQDNTLVVKPGQALSAGRSRYNCTAPNMKNGGYYWYSHTWFKKRADGSWYAEY